MSSEKTDLARAGTMQVTAQEGKVFLDKNLTEWKKPYLADHFADGEGEDEEEEEKAPAPAPKGKGKAKLAKHTTMKGTAKEAAELLGNDAPDPDAATRGQQKKLDEISTPPAKKRKSAGGSISKANTMSKTLEEAKNLYGDLDLSGGRSLRKRPAPAAAAKPAMKKAGTMQSTAKEGKAFLKRSKKTGGKKKADEEKNGDAE